MKKEQTIIMDKDIYFIEKVGDRIVTNDNYVGILIFDYNLNLIENINMFDDMIVSSWISNNTAILLFCEDNNCIVFVDAYTLEHEVIEVRKCDKFFFANAILLGKE